MSVVLRWPRVYSGPVPELLGLAEIKKRAKADGYTKISRLADAGTAVPLDSWNGVTVDAESGFADADISYILNGNTVIVREIGKGDIYYGMF
jgi:hypothetical protein